MLTNGPLIGRDRELAELEQELNGSRLLTLIGVGGCGKTRVALELAQRARAAGGPEYVVVELADVLGARQMLGAVLASVGVRERPGSTPVQMLRDFLAPRRMLIILDSCERVAEAAGELLEELLAAAPALQVLATTREPLGIPGERMFQLGQLSLPDSAGEIGSVVRSDAGRLFVERAAACDPAFVLTAASAQAVTSICRELDGLPLGIILAAARLQGLSVTEVAEGLARAGRLAGAADEGAPPRHRSLQASLDWSYELLGEREQALLRGLAVFSGGFTAAAAHAVLGAGDSEADTRSLLHALRAKCLLVPVDAPGEERWTLLRTVAEYAAGQLAAQDESERTADAHLAWFRRYAARTEGLLLEPNAQAAIDAEAANLWLALERALAEEVPVALEIAASLMCHWLLAEHYEEAFAASSAALAASGPQLQTPARAVVECGAGLIGMLRGEYAEALANTGSGLANPRVAEDPRAEALCLLTSSMVLIPTGVDLAGGLRNADRARRLQRDRANPVGLAYALANAAMASAICDRFDAARASYEEFLEVPKASEHPRLRTWAEAAAAWVEVMSGSPERALAHADRALALEAGAASMTRFQCASFRVHALARSGRGEQAHEEGERLMREAHESHAPHAVPAIELALLVADFMRGDFEDAQRRARGLLEVPQLHTLALVREVIGRIALVQGDAREAAAQARELQDLAERSESSRQRAIAQFIAGSAAILLGERERALELLHSALLAEADLGLERDAADALEQLALLAISGDEVERAARLAAAAGATRTRLDCTAPAWAGERLDAARARLVSDAETWDVAWRDGAALELADAIAYARRGRGQRSRPQAGWASLTPVESEVAQLVTSGMSNPQIAARLFISRSTVKMHLSSVFAKLGVANRTELAARMAARTPAPRAPTSAPDAPSHVPPP